MWEQLIAEILRNHRGKLFGISLGLVFALLVLFLGLLQTIFISSCIYIGYVVGKRIDDNESLREVIERLFKER